MLKCAYSDEPERHVSHETTYKAIYPQPRGELRHHLIVCLRQGRGMRIPRVRGTDLSVFSQHELAAIADSLNGPARAVHHWHTPLEASAKTLASAVPLFNLNPLIQACCASKLKPLWK